MKQIGHVSDINKQRYEGKGASDSNFVLDKSIFSNIFEKDIRKVYIYKKSERLAKALQMIAPAFNNSPALRARIDQLSVDIIDAAILGTSEGRTLLGGEILALSSLLEIARAGELLSSMNAEIIGREARSLLQEVSSYEAPRIDLGDAPTLPLLQKSTTTTHVKKEVQHKETREIISETFPTPPGIPELHKGQVQIKDKRIHSNRREEILSIIRDKKEISIKDISLIMKGISEKTVQRELQSLVQEGVLLQKGSRRWTTYSFKN